MRRLPKLTQFLSFLWGFSFLELIVNMSNMLETVSETVLGLPGCKDAQRTWIDASTVKSPDSLSPSIIFKFHVCVWWWVGVCACEFSTHGGQR